MKTSTTRRLACLLTASAAILPMGAIAPPFAEDFSTEDGFNAFTICDVNQDEETWYFSKKKAVIAYNDEIGMDDWLISPALELQANSIYPLKFAINGRSTSAKYVERFEVCLATSPTAEAMTVNVMPVYEFTSKEVREMTVMIPVASEGTYYIGFHCCSAPGMYGMELDDIELGEAQSGMVPSAVADFTVVPDPMGVRSVGISFHVPSVSAVGSPLESVEKVEIRRDGETIETITDVQPGEFIERTYDSPGGYHIFSAEVINAEGVSPVVESEVFVGVNRAPAPEWVDLKATGNPGEVCLTWAQVSEDVDGNAINPALVRYRVYDNYNKTVVIDDYDGTAYTFTPVSPDRQEIVYYDVWTVTDGGVSSEAIRSQAIPVGKPYDVPFRMSFTEADLDRYQMAQNPLGGVWQLSFDDETVKSQDGDNAMMGLFGYNPGDGGELFTGLIHLGEMPNPTLTVYCYHMALAQGGVSVANETEIALILKEGETAHTLKSLKAYELPAFGWNRVCADVPSELIGKDVQIYVRVISANCPWTFVDNISLASVFDYDLSAEISAIPRSVAPGEVFQITGKVMNIGLKDVDGDYTVTLLRDGEPIASRPGVALPVGTSCQFLFETSLNVASPEATDYSLMVDYEADGYPADNLSEIAEVRLDLPDYPIATALAARSENGSVVVEWNAPVYEMPVSEEFSDTLESYPSFATSGVGEWTFIDRDQSPIGFINKLTFPGIEPNSLQSFWVCDDTQLNSTSETYKAHSGNKYFAAMYRADDKAADDWVISPLLCGEAQTIRFYASSVDTNYSDSFEVLYSTGSVDPVDFVRVGGENNIPKQWIEYSFDLPQGATRFAIRSIGASSTMLKLDDITYMPAVPDLTLCGYNVYRDGTKLNSEPVEECSFSDKDVERGHHSYGVSVVYKAGESPMSDTVDIDHQTSGLEVENTGVLKIVAYEDALYISGAEGQMVTIATPDGRSTTRHCDAMVTRIPLAPGLYIVKVGDHVSKHRL